jgi:hypothetical protein
MLLLSSSFFGIYIVHSLFYRVFVHGCNWPCLAVVSHMTKSVFLLLLLI